MKRCAFVMLFVLLVAGLPQAALAEQYWVAWEGNDFPENEGWERIHGDWSGPGNGGSHRTLANSAMTMDTLFDNGVYDFSRMMMPGRFTLNNQEVFIAHWRIQVDALTGQYDPTLGIYSDDGWGLAARFGTNGIDLPFENTWIKLDLTYMRSFEIITTDFRTYSLIADGALLHSGHFWEPATTASYVAWGDGIQGISSVSTWDYFRFGIVPEPPITGSALIYGLAVLSKRRA